MGGKRKREKERKRESPSETFKQLSHSETRKNLGLLNSQTININTQI
jgi:hypothetical protein